MSSISEGLFAGRAGIQSHGSAISVLADNIANSNTVGFKQSRAEFIDLLAGNISGQGSSSAIGSGSSVKNVTQIFTQGDFEFTGRGLDLAIDGNGFFVVQDNAGTRQYSRAGNFKIDAKGNLLNQNGNKVLGFPEEGSGGLEPLNVNTIATTSQPTQNVKISGNLDAKEGPGTGDSVGDAVLGAGNTGAVTGETFQSISGEARHSTFCTIYDSLGQDHTVNLYFYKTATQNPWVVSAYVDSSEVTGGTVGVPYRVGTTTLTFQGDGTRATVPPYDIRTQVIDWASGANDASVDLSFDPYTQFSTPSNISSIVQDGSGSGSVTSFNVETDGTLFATLDNGQTSAIGKLALAVFGNSEALRRTGESLYSESHGSGQPVIGTPETGKFGSIQAGALELSTADIASDFIKLISFQRGFQGSSRIISNIDELLKEIINLA